MPGQGSRKQLHRHPLPVVSVVRLCKGKDRTVPLGCHSEGEGRGVRQGVSIMLAPPHPQHISQGREPKVQLPASIGSRKRTFMPT